MTKGRGEGSFGLVLLLALLAFPAAVSAQATPPPVADAFALLQAQDWEGAREAFGEIVAASPEDGLSWLRLARALIELSREDEAIAAIDRAVEAQFQSPFVQVFRARALVRLGRNDEALSVLEEIQPTAAAGGSATLTGVSDFSAIQDSPRYQNILTALDAAAFPCRDNPVSREFDFWIGTWDVTVGGGPAGVNVVEGMLEGCTLQENWTNVGGREGKSFNWVDRSSFRTPTWRQLWVDDSGNTLDYYNGRYEDGAMRFEGHTFDAQGDSIPQRLIFENVAADTVRQIFQQSNDGGGSWVVTWQGLYVRRR